MRSLSLLVTMSSYKHTSRYAGDGAFYVAALVKLFLVSSSPHAIIVPVEGPTGACLPPCAGGFLIRGALWPQTTFYPW